MLSKKSISSNFSNHFFYSSVCIAVTLGYSYLLLLTGKLNTSEDHFFSTVYFDMWKHLIDFDLGVSPQLVGNEGFWMGDKTTVYFLPLPALMRGFLSIFNMGESAVSSILLAVFFFVIASLSLWHSLYNHVFSSSASRSITLYRLGIGLFSICTPIIATLAFPGIFWEAITWGAATLIGSAALSVRLLQSKFDPSPAITYLAFTIACSATLFTRATFSFASCWLFFLTTMFFLYQHRVANETLLALIIKNKVVIINSALFGFFLGCLLLFNYMKWGNPFEFYPIEQYKMFGEEELALFKKIGPLNFNRIPENFAYFFIPSKDNFFSEFPYIQMGTNHLLNTIEKFNYQEPNLPLTLIIPVIILLSFIGIISLFSSLVNQQKWILSFIPSLFCSLIPVFFILSHHAQSIRYIGDFMPALVLFSQLGFASLISIYAQSHISQDASQSNNKAYKRNTLSILTGIVFLVLLVIASFGPLLQNHYWRTQMSGVKVPAMQFNKPVMIQTSSDLASSTKILGTGWYPAEDWGVWSKGNENSYLLITPPLGSNSKNHLSLRVNALITKEHPLQILELWVNGQLIKTVNLQDNSDHEVLIAFPPPANVPAFFAWLYENMLSSIEKSTRIPLTSHKVILEIKAKLPISPKELGLSQDDMRQIGIGLKSIQVKSKMN